MLDVNGFIKLSFVIFIFTYLILKESLIFFLGFIF